MSIDYTKNAYDKVGSFSNVVNEIPTEKQRPGNPKSVLHPHLLTLIEKVALRHPEWTLVGEDSWYNPSLDGYFIKRVRVYEGADQIGSIVIDTWREEKFEIRNSRIANTMAKRNYKSTKDVDKALKIIEEFFSAKTMGERMSEARAKVSSVIQNHEWTVRRQFDSMWNIVTPAIITYVALNLPQLRPVLEAYGAPATALDVLIEHSENHKLAKNLMGARTAGKGTTVLLHGDRYIVVRDADPDNPQTVTASQLDDDMRGKLGVLKVVGDNDAIESIGMRINATTFYLLP